MKIIHTELEREYGLDSSGSEEGPVAGTCEHSSHPSVSIKCFLG
jgi:hypothetical protein